MKLYLAGPWFNEDQNEREQRVKAALRSKGFEVFSPREASELKPNASKEDQQKVFEIDINGIKDADAVFAITNGKDMGTLFECGYAYANKVPIIYFAENLTGQFNLMLARSAHLVYTNLEDVDYYEIALHITNDIKKDFEGEIE